MDVSGESDDLRSSVQRGASWLIAPLEPIVDLCHRLW